MMSPLSYIIPELVWRISDLQSDRYELNNTRRGRRDLPKGMYVCHDIVSALLLFFGCDLELRRGEVLIDQHERIRNNKLSRNPSVEGGEPTRLFFICSIAWSEIGKPSCFSAIARLSHSFRHVWNRFCISESMDQLVVDRDNMMVACVLKQRTDEPFLCSHTGCDKIELIRLFNSKYSDSHLDKGVWYVSKSMV